MKMKARDRDSLCCRRKSWKRLRVRSESTKKVLELRLIAEGGVCYRCKGNVKDEFEH